MLLRDSDISEEEGECGVLGLFKMCGADEDTERQGGDTERTRLERGGACRRGNESGYPPPDLAGLELAMYTSLA